MGDSWKYAQVLHLPEDNKCDCGHYRKDHHNMKSFCYLCRNEFDKCEKFQKWSVERVRIFWNIVNSKMWLETGTEQTILDDYSL